MRIGFIGCNATAAVLARGWGERILCADADAARAIGLAAHIGGDALMTYEAVARRADIALLCHEPADLGEIAAAVAPHAGIVVSTLEQTPLHALRHAYPDRSVYRVAVNQPAAIRRGVTVLAQGPRQADDDSVGSLFARLGNVIVVDDALIDSAAALMSDVAAGCATVIDAHARNGSAPAALEHLAAFSRIGAGLYGSHRLPDGV